LKGLTHEAEKSGRGRQSVREVAQENDKGCSTVRITLVYGVTEKKPTAQRRREEGVGGDKNTSPKGRERPAGRGGKRGKVRGFGQFGWSQRGKIVTKKKQRGKGMGSYKNFGENQKRAQY